MQAHGRNDPANLRLLEEPEELDDAGWPKTSMAIVR
jgi:hypothetical protein